MSAADAAPGPAVGTVETGYGRFGRDDFGPDFTWGVATSAYQVEGAWDADGKGPSIWDTFCRAKRGPRRRSPIRDGSDGDVACDFYHRYRDDVALVAELGFGAKRFSISWPRVLPQGTGPVNRAGLDFYSRVVDECLARGVEPWITLFHWDLPQALEDRGGWSSRDVVGWFEEYVATVADALGDRVRRWMVFNEPVSFVLLGHLTGEYAPGGHSRRRFLGALHHVNLCQAVGARVLRERVPGAVVGTTHYLTDVRATGTTALHRRAATAADAFINRTYLEPNLGLGYPTDDCPFLAPVERFFRDGDEQAIRVDLDFLGVQYYTCLLAPLRPVPGLWTIPDYARDPLRSNTTALGWEITPEGLYDTLAKVHAYGRYPSLVITENGATEVDRVVDGRIHDARRLLYIQEHLAQVARARRDGLPLDGYFVWSLMDNFEWSDGYVPRLGIVHVDFDTQVRTPKDSARWFQRFLAG
jgi:beta-glucosidase